MVKYNCLNPVSNEGLKRFTGEYEKVENFAEADIALVRSAAMHDLELPQQLLAVARAGAGVNNIPLDKFDYTIDATVKLEIELKEAEKIAKEIAKKYN